MVVALHGRAGVCGGACGREAQFGPRRAGRSGRGSGAHCLLQRAAARAEKVAAGENAVLLRGHTGQIISGRVIDAVLQKAAAIEHQQAGVIQHGQSGERVGALIAAQQQRAPGLRVHVQPRKTALRRSGVPGGQRQCADMLPRGDEAEFGIKLQHRAVGIKINAVAGAAPVVQYGFHQTAGKALAAVLRSRHHRAQLHQPQRLATPHRVDAVDRDVGCRAAVPVYHRIGNVAVRPPARAVPFLERKAEHTPGQCEKTLPQGSIVPHLLDERIVHAPFPLSPAALCAAASSAGHCTIFPRRRKER